VRGKRSKHKRLSTRNGSLIQCIARLSLVIQREMESPSSFFIARFRNKSTQFSDLFERQSFKHERLSARELLLLLN
jgi:hypothetical protein